MRPFVPIMLTELFEPDAMVVTGLIAALQSVAHQGGTEGSRSRRSGVLPHGGLG